jgi:hypothetical protein
MTHQEDLLLAAWRYGLGRSVAFTADAKAKWGVLWLRWRDYAKFWSQVVRWTLRAGVRRDTTVHVDRRDCQAVVTVEAIDPQGQFINFLDGQIGGSLGDTRVPGGTPPAHPGLRAPRLVDLTRTGRGKLPGRRPRPSSGDAS